MAQVFEAQCLSLWARVCAVIGFSASGRARLKAPGFGAAPKLGALYTW